MYPYVGKYIAHLTLAQVKTLDCGSKRHDDYRKITSLTDSYTADIALPALQLTYPGMRISTLKEVFDFAECADPLYQILWNIESKINPRYPNRTLGVADFVNKQQAIFKASLYHKSIIVRYSTSFTLIHLTVRS